MKVAFVFVVSCDAQSNPLYVNAQKLIKKQDLENRFFLFNKPIDFITLMKQCDLVLRPTNSDGDALTIREALYFNIPVIASDIVKRPPGTILFKNRDAKDLMHRTIDVLKVGSRPICMPAETGYNSYFYKYLDLYLGVLNHRRRLKAEEK